MKKPFRETKIGKFLTSPIVRGAVTAIPFGVGSIASNVLNEVNSTKEGEIDWRSMRPTLVKLAFYVLLALAVHYGLLTADEAQQVKGLAE